jgi:hypothetical protein
MGYKPMKISQLSFRDARGRDRPFKIESEVAALAQIGTPVEPTA